MDGDRSLHAIHNLDYTILFARDLDAMRRFYRETMGFTVHRELGPSWTEYRVGGTVLALTQPAGCSTTRRRSPAR